MNDSFMFVSCYQQKGTDIRLQKYRRISQSLQMLLIIPNFYQKENMDIEVLLFNVVAIVADKLLLEHDLTTS